MRLKNTPTLTKGIVTNHMTTKAIIMAKKVTTIHTKVTTMKAITTKLMSIITMATIMKAITMKLTKVTTMPKKLTSMKLRQRHTTMMPTLTKVIITMLMKVTTMDMATIMEAILMKSSWLLTRPKLPV